MESLQLFNRLVISFLCLNRHCYCSLASLTLAVKLCAKDYIDRQVNASLSGGERQRLSIARALLKDAPVVLLDEATASLDPENETLIQRAVGTLCAGKTVIVIAHRLRTVANADKIVVLDSGRVAEEGNHKIKTVRRKKP